MKTCGADVNAASDDPDLRLTKALAGVLATVDGLEKPSEHFDGIVAGQRDLLGRRHETLRTLHLTDGLVVHLEKCEKFCGGVEDEGGRHWAAECINPKDLEDVLHKAELTVVDAQSKFGSFDEHADTLRDLFATAQTMESIFKEQVDKKIRDRVDKCRNMLTVTRAEAMLATLISITKRDRDKTDAEKNIRPNKLMPK